MSDSVDVDEVGDFAALSERYSADWRRIADASPVATVFQTWEWAASWWECFGRGRRRLRVLVFTENKIPVGFAPLMGPLLPSLLRTWQFLGTSGSDYLDLLALPGQEDAVCSAFQQAMAARKGRWDWLDLQQVRPGAVAERLSGHSEQGIGTVSWEGETCPYLPLGSDWEETRRVAWGKKLRQNIGYYGRALEKAFGVEYRLATEETLADDLESFFFLHQKRWNKRWLPGAFASRRARTFHETVARRLLLAGRLRLHTLSLDGEVQAALYCFQKDDRCCYYLGGFEPDLARWSLGTVLTAQAIRYAIEQDQCKEFDFLRGNEGYKYHWGAQDRFNQRLSLTHSGVRPLLLSAVGRGSLEAERRLKAWMHRRHSGGRKHG